MFEKLANELILNGDIQKEDKEIYIYGLREGLIMLGNVVTTILVGFLLGMWWQSIIFIVAYSPLRSFAGGAHAKTHLRCYFLSILLTAVTLATIKYLPKDLLVIEAISLLAGLIIFLLAPVEDKNKPLDNFEILVYRKKAKVILLVELLITFILLKLTLLEVASCISISTAMLAIMLILGKIVNIKNVQINKELDCAIRDSTINEEEEKE